MPSTSPNAVFDPGQATPSAKISDAVIQAAVPTDSQAQTKPIYGEDKVAQVNSSANPEDVLDIPPVMAVFQGKPAAAYATAEDADNPVVQEIGQRLHDVLAIGLNVYRSLKGDDHVLFNPKHIQGQRIKDADRAGDLSTVATHIDDLIPANYQPGQTNAPSPEGPASAAQAGLGQPGTPPAGPSTPPVTAASGRPAAASAQSDLMNARLRSLTAGTPTSGAAPGRGRILNQLLRPAV